MAWLYQRKWLYIRLPVTALALAVIAWLWLFVYPMPPDKLSISTAGKDGAYDLQAQQYAQNFAAHGIRLDVQTSEGSQENLERLRSASEPSDLALMQGGFGYLGATTENRELSRIETLANINIEAVWLFSINRSITSINQLQGLRVAVGPERSGSRKVALKLFEQAKIDLKDITLSKQTGTDAVRALQQGMVDVVFFVASRESSTVQSLLKIPGIQLASLAKTAAIVERNPYLEASLLPQSTLDVRVPSRDTAMLTMSTSLVARQGLHPALKRLATAVTMEVHHAGGLFHRAGDFPSLRRIDFPTAPHTRYTLAQGLPLHERLLPFWWAQLAERLVLLVLPVVLLALWLVLRIPHYVRWVLQNRVNRWYGALKFIENDLSQEKVSGLDMARYLVSLNNIDKAVLAFHCPKDLMARCYTLHQHIEFVRQRLYRMRGR
ncbi:MAG: TAXI family TRAP transporter solute-binding subunit [Polaromonas sp.]